MLLSEGVDYSTIETTHSFLGAVLGIGASILGGLSAKKQAKKQAAAAEEAAKVPMVTDSDTQHVVDLKAMNAAAIEAGYNPLTLLRSGGVQAFTRSHSKSTTTGHNAMAAAQAQAAVPSTGSIIMGALGDGLSSVAQSMPSFSGKVGAFGGAAPVSAVASVASSLGLGGAGFGAAAGGGGVTKGGVVKNAGAPMTPVFKAPETVNPWRTYSVDSTTGGAEPFTQRYGESELAEMVAGTLSLADDVWYNITGMTSQQRNEQFGKPLVNAVKNAFEASKSATIGTDVTKAVGGAVWDTEKWLRNNVFDVWFPPELSR
nr:MAG: DNA pilot protein [Microvirus sp.]